MKATLLTLAAAALLPAASLAQGWPASHGGVMLQGFYWDSFTATAWSNLESQASDMQGYFDLVWVPQSANCGGTSMGYDDLYWFSNYNSSFGTEAELRSMISTFKQHGIGTIADVVVNHRKNLSNWVDFPAETYNGVTYQLQSTDIVSDDDGGATATWAASNGYSLSSNRDTGEGWSGMRDLDHNSANVQNSVKAYLNLLLNDLGYAGVRYDMVKGYSGSFTGIYNSSANVQYSVGEYWDGNVTLVKNWIDATKVDGERTSAAFDFPFRYTCRDAANKGTWSSLANASLMSDAGYRQQAVTFVENHDTEYRSASAQQDPIRKDTLAVNAFMLAMPGTPCVFLKHWQAYEQEIKAMIDARHLAGITNTSNYSNYRSATSYFANIVTGTNGQLLVAVGNTSMVNPSANWVKILDGYHYTYYMSSSTNTAWVDMPNGTYTEAFDATLTAVAAEGTKLVYTLDGSTPTASSTQVASGTKVNITGDCTLTVGVLVNGAVTGIVKRNYTIKVPEPFTPYTITVYLKDPTGAPNNWSNVYYYCWDSADNTLEGSWPGTRVTGTTTVKGDTFYYRTYDITASDYFVNFVFNQGGSTAGSHQTVDVTRINKDAYFEIASTTNKYEVNDITSQYASASGDVNGDGLVDASDVTALVAIMLGNSDGSTDVADINSDGVVDAADVTALIAILLGA